MTRDGGKSHRRRHAPIALGRTRKVRSALTPTEAVGPVSWKGKEMPKKSADKQNDAIDMLGYNAADAEAYRASPSRFASDAEAERMMQDRILYWE